MIVTYQQNNTTNHDFWIIHSVAFTMDFFSVSLPLPFMLEITVRVVIVRFAEVPKYFLHALISITFQELETETYKSAFTTKFLIQNLLLHLSNHEIFDARKTLNSSAALVFDNSYFWRLKALSGIVCHFLRFYRTISVNRSFTKKHN